jgi:opacity protein-like surface antigen
MEMFRSALVATALLVVAVPAVAGGFAPVVTTPPPATPVVVAPPVAPSADWSGFYAGGQLGFGNAIMDITDGEQSAEFAEGSGALYGVHAGYMHDFGRLVVGGELDWDFGSVGLDLNPAFDTGSLGSIDSIGRAKLRVGYDAGRFLPYVTAGLARASFSYDAEGADGVIDDTATGRFIGVGAAYAVNDRFTIGLEALRHDFNGPGVSGETDGLELETEVTTVSLRASYRF